MKKRSIIIFLLFFTFSFCGYTQNITATAHLDTNQITIGDYLNITFKVNTPKDQMILFPVMDEKFVELLETPFDWISNTPIDTIFENNQLILSQKLTIIVFDSGSYTFPPIPFFNIDSLLVAQSNPLQFQVSTIAVDTTAAYKDIKPISKAPFGLHELWLYLKKHGLVILLSLILIGIIIYLLIRYLKNRKRKKPREVKQVIPVEEAHIIALRELELLNQKKLWEAGKIKQYYSELSEIIRVYIENRWQISAMEMVSSEIIMELQKVSIFKEEINRIEKMFEMADLVKFAKWNPLLSDHHLAFQFGKQFVENTAKLESNTEETDNNTHQEGGSNE